MDGLSNSDVALHMSDMQKIVVNKYMDGYARVKTLHDAYNK